MSLFIAQFHIDSAELSCNNCGHPIAINYMGSSTAYGTWQEAEDKATHAKHECEMQVDLEQARKEMKKYRRTHAPMTFEEECKVYNQIMKNQTFLQ